MVIGLPILGFIIILIALATCCFFFIRYRRKRVRRNRYQSHLYERWNDTTIGTPRQNQGAWGWAGQSAYSDHDQAAGATAAYGHGLGFGFVDNDGQAHDVGYGYDHSQAKTGFQHGVSEAPFSEINVSAEAMHGYPPDQKHAL